MNVVHQRRTGTPRVLDLTAPQRAPRLEFDVSPGYELLVALQGLSSPEAWSTYDQGAPWFEAVRSRMSNDLRERLHGGRVVGEGCRSEFAHLAGLVSDAPRRDDAESVVEHLAALPASTFRRALLESAFHWTARREHADALAAASAGDPAAVARLREIVAAEGEGKEVELVDVLLSEPPEVVQEEIVLILREACSLLGDHLAGILPALRLDAGERRHQVEGLPLEEAIEVATNGIHYTPEPGIRRVLIVPQAAMRPWVLITEHGDTKIFMVAVAEESLAADLDTPPARLLAVTKALAEEQRLRILRRLATGGPASLQQIADHLGVAKSTAHHHLVQLRAAGLTVVDITEDREYHLREGLAGGVAELLDTYLRGGARAGRTP